MCKSYKLDVSAIDIPKIKDKNTQDQIFKILNEIKIDPYSGEKKRYNLKDYYTKKLKGKGMCVII
jgi:Txe/YoeB family toxin of Txe-Axe toxin-antitoxin module